MRKFGHQATVIDALIYEVGNSHALLARISSTLSVRARTEMLPRRGDPSGAPSDSAPLFIAY